jgi:YfiH family protein
MITPPIFNGAIKAFFTRKDTGADPETVGRALSVSKEKIFMPVQKHTDRVLIVRSNSSIEIADAVLTAEENMLIGVQVADCVPILLYDKMNSVIGAVHAGWKGTAARILPKTIHAMKEYFSSSPENILAAFGPSIRWECYPVGDEVKDAVSKASGEGEYFLYNDNKYCVDLSSANIYQALSMGVSREHIWISPECTRCNPDAFFSYRYSKAYEGSQGGFIGIL